MCVREPDKVDKNGKIIEIGKIIGTGDAKSKKEAEQQASQETLTLLGVQR
jgi:dsRNA-specific ribonuclease